MALMRMELLTAAQMRAVEAAAIAGGSVTGLALMERAGAAVVAAMLQRWPEFDRVPGRALVLCGPGNNGGDGYVIARLLAERGWQVHVHALGDPQRLPPDAAAQFAAWRGPVAALGCPRPEAETDFIIDALFGTGLARPIDPETVQILQNHACSRARIVAVDTPSGLDADTGTNCGVALPADLTVTFHRAKLGHHLEAGPGLCGALLVADIGLFGDGPNSGPGADPVLMAPTRPDLLPKCQGHKYGHGHALILGGGPGQGGAGRLAARGALRAGAGAVTLGVPPAALAENAARLDAVMLSVLRDAAALRHMLRDARITALCVGPGFGLGAAQAALLGAVLASERATVLDADALTLLAREAGLRAALHPRCVLTPHGGEFARLFPDIAARLAALDRAPGGYSKVDAARDAARDCGCVMLLKGSDTVIAAPDGRAVISSANYAAAVPWLATAGAGDVLAGIIAGLLARGFAPFEAAETGAWLHAQAGLRFGPGLTADDLPDCVPLVLRDLQL